MGVTIVHDSMNATIDWPQGEIKKGEEKRYDDWLRNSQLKIEVLRRDLFECCTFNLYKRFKILSKFLIDSGLGLDIMHPDVDTCLEFASGSRSLDVARMILELADKNLIMHAIAFKNYSGCTALHIAVLNELAEITLLMLSKLDEKDQQELMNMHATGTDMMKDMKLTTLALHMACYMGNIEIFQILVQHGAELDHRDKRRGNTILHVLVELGCEQPDLAKQTFEAVFRNKYSMMWYMSRHKEQGNQWSKHDCFDFKKYMLCLEDDDGYTPLTYAAMLGSVEMIDFIMNIEGAYRMTTYKIGRKSFVMYNIGEVESSISQRGFYAKPNVMELLVYRPIRRQTLPVFSNEVIEGLITAKWKYFKFLFIIWGLVHVFLMLFCYKLPTDFLKVKKNMALSSNISNGTLNVNFTKTFATNPMAHLYIFISLLVYLINELQDIFYFIFNVVVLITRRWHRRSYNAPILVIIKTNIYRFILCIYIISQLVAMINITVYSKFDVFSSTVAYISGFYFLLYFFSGWNLTGYFSCLLHYILVTDLLSFALVFGIVLTGFGGAMMLAIYESVNDKLPPGFHDVYQSAYMFFKYLTGFSSIDNIDVSIQSVGVKLVFVLFVCLTVLLLLNMLIAAMSETYATMGLHRQEICNRSKAATILLMERRTWVSCCFQNFLKKRYLKTENGKDWWLSVETLTPPTCYEEAQMDSYEEFTSEEPLIETEHRKESISGNKDVIFTPHGCT